MEGDIITYTNLQYLESSNALLLPLNQLWGRHRQCRSDQREELSKFLNKFPVIGSTTQ